MSSAKIPDQTHHRFNFIYRPKPMFQAWAINNANACHKLEGANKKSQPSVVSIID